MPKRLIGRILRIRPHVRHGDILLIRRRRPPTIGAVAQKRALDALVRVRGPFGAEAFAAGSGFLAAAAAGGVVAFDAIAAAGAAAGGKEPEEAGGPGEGDREPDEDEDVVAEGGVDVVFGQGVVEGPRQGGEEDGGGEGEAD